MFPATITAEREDIGAGSANPLLTPMQKLVEPYGEARDDYEIFCALSERLGCLDAFSEGRTSREWQKHLYRKTEDALQRRGANPPDFNTFMDGMQIELPLSHSPGMMEQFHADPVSKPLATESGRIVLYSQIVKASGLPGHPAWIEPLEWLGAPLARTHAFQLVANQPHGKLHSQLDFGATSMATKNAGREVARMNSHDARALDLSESDVIRIWNARGSVLAAVSLSDAVAKSVIQLSTGSWYAPIETDKLGIVCVNGNPNAVTSDRPASCFSQGSTGQICLVSVEKLSGPRPGIVAHEMILRKSRLA